ncbi:hypothetical protein [Actinacidiphila epipremni]|uniref:Uncharacterized protein n=1 Tax=Actinacidiphila epipremni TaxID=2053013 RepID=A0ABX0ZGX9_9ACTN|nr:hypothetical protein [Actinacidiphila epipremni]NJP42285.1 hypothetical protein [Actinacidiphila epipremni]
MSDKTDAAWAAIAAAGATPPGTVEHDEAMARAEAAVAAAEDEHSDE